MSTYCCKGCLNDVVGCLVAGDVLRVYLSGLVNGEVYVATITDAQGNSYGVPFGYDDTTKHVDLPIGEGGFPATLFNVHIGELKFEIQAPDGNCVPFVFMTWAKCIELSVVDHMTGAYQKDEIGLDQTP